MKSEQTTAQVQESLTSYEEARGPMRLDPEARNHKHTHIQELPEKSIWIIQQTLVDQEDTNDHLVHFQLDLKETDKERAPVLQFIGLQALSR